MKTILSCVFCLLLSSLAFGQKTPVLFQKVRVFDGAKVIPETDVPPASLKKKTVVPALMASLSKAPHR
jgi:hypothetical protein